jgi:hypothetical protein
MLRARLRCGNTCRVTALRAGNACRVTALLLEGTRSELRATWRAGRLVHTKLSAAKKMVYRNAQSKSQRSTCIHVYVTV